MSEKIAGPISWLFFGIWLLIALAAADFPPPPGFMLLVAILAACSVLVYRRVPAYLGWGARRAKGRLLRVVRDGAIGGGTIALLLMLVSAGEPSVQPGPIDRLIWLALLVALGVGNALAVYAVGWWLSGRGQDCTTNVFYPLMPKPQQDLATKLKRRLVPPWRKEE